MLKDAKQYLTFCVQSSTETTSFNPRPRGSTGQVPSFLLPGEKPEGQKMLGNPKLKQPGSRSGEFRLRRPGIRVPYTRAPLHSAVSSGVGSQTQASRRPSPCPLPHATRHAKVYGTKSAAAGARTQVQAHAVPGGASPTEEGRLGISSPGFRFGLCLVWG